MSLRPCERCGAQGAGYIDIDFTCNRRRCPMRDVLDAKAECIKVAQEGNPPPEVVREVVKILFDTMYETAQKDLENLSEEEAVKYAGDMMRAKIVRKGIR